MLAVVENSASPIFALPTMRTFAQAPGASARRERQAEVRFFALFGESSRLPSVTPSGAPSSESVIGPS